MKAELGKIYAAFDDEYEPMKRPFLPAPVELEEAEAMALWQRGDLSYQFAEVLKGYAAACYQKGGGLLEDFAKKTDAPYSSIKDQARVYTRITSLDKDDQSSLLRAIRDGVLRYTHFLRASPVTDDAAFIDILERAAAKNKNTGWVAAEVRDWKKYNYPENYQDKAPKGEEPGDVVEAAQKAAQIVLEGGSDDLGGSVITVVETRPRIIPQEVTEAVGQQGRYQILDVQNYLELELSDDETWNALIDTETGEIIMAVASIQSVDAFVELIENANKGAKK